MSFFRLHSLFANLCASSFNIIEFIFKCSDALYRKATYSLQCSMLN